MRPWSRRALAIPLLIAAVPALALAAQTFQRPGTAAPKTPTPTSTSSISALTGRMAIGTNPAPVRTASAEEQALIAIRDDAARRVETLTRQAAQTPDGPARATMLKQVGDIKRDSELRFLGIKADFARRRGDLATASRIEDLIAARRAPQAVRQGASATPKAPGTRGDRP